MTDLEKLKALLDKWGVGYHESRRDFIRQSLENFDGVAITIDGVANDSEKWDSYLGFFTEFVFNPDGSFKMMGAWE